MAFPSSPTNEDLHTEFGRTFKYSSATNSWSVATPDAPEDTTPSTQGYVDVESLPLTGVVAGSKAFVEDGNKLFIFTGNGWFEIATINTAPTITTGADASYALNDDGTPTVITLQATDPEGTPIIWGYQVASGSLEGTTITNVDNVFTITPGEVAATFDLTFTASDGINIDTSASSFALNFTWSRAAVNYGYTSGGNSYPSAGVFRSTIDKFPFSSDTMSTGVGTLSVPVALASGQSSSVAGYVTGGSGAPPTPQYIKDSIQKFSFSSEGTTTSVGTLGGRRSQSSGCSSLTDGYHNGGFTNIPGNALKQEIYKFSFSSEGASTLSGFLLSAEGLRHIASTSADDYGYVHGGGGSTPSDITQKYPFASDANATTDGTLAGPVTYACGLSTQDYAYLASGSQPSFHPSVTVFVSKYAYASSTAITSAGSLSVAKYKNSGAGVSGASEGYIPGGGDNLIITASVEKYSFASETGSGSFGSLSADTVYPTNNQY